MVPHASPTRLADPVTLDSDRVRQAQLRPIPGQECLPLAACGYVPSAAATLPDDASFAETLIMMTNRYGHCSQ